MVMPLMEILLSPPTRTNDAKLELPLSSVNLNPSVFTCSSQRNRHYFAAPGDF
jgi:hypothetical protein